MQGTQGNDTLTGSEEIDDYFDGQAGDDWIEGGEESVALGATSCTGNGQRHPHRWRRQRLAIPGLVFRWRERQCGRLSRPGHPDQ
jgi:hypothetical protein